MAQKRALGRGVENLIPSGEPSSTSTKAAKTVVTKTEIKEVIKKVEQTLNINKIEPNREQPRKNFNEDALAELADSIKKHGMIEPIVVVKRKGYYEIIAGERRWRAARLAGLKEVPVVIKNYTEQEIVEVALIENLQREDLNPIEEAFAYDRLIKEFNLTQDEVAEKVSKGRSTITNSLRLLKLTPDVQQMLIDEKLTAGHVRNLITIEDPDLQLEVAELIFDKHMSVRETENYIKKLNKTKTAPKKEIEDEKDYSFLYKEIEEKLKNVLGTKTSIKSKGKKGKIEIEYYSDEDLERITQMLYNIN